MLNLAILSHVPSLVLNAVYNADILDNPIFEVFAVFFEDLHFASPLSKNFHFPAAQ